MAAPSYSRPVPLSGRLTASACCSVHHGAPVETRGQVPTRETDGRITMTDKGDRRPSGQAVAAGKRFMSVEFNSIPGRDVRTKGGDAGDNLRAMVDHGGRARDPSRSTTTTGAEVRSRSGRELWRRLAAWL